MRKPAPLPAELVGVGFVNPTDWGVSAERLRRSDLEGPFHGVHATSIRGFEAYCAAYALTMPAHQYFCGVTAAHLLGLRYPLGALDRTLHVGTPKPTRAPRGVGITGHQLSPATPLITLDYGLRVSSPLDTWCQLADRVKLDDVVAIGDGLICRQDPVCTLDELTKAVAAWTNRPGVLALRQAMLEVRERTDSARETLLRLLLTRAGFAEPIVNHAILDDTGLFLGFADLCFVKEKVIVEYDGGHHRSEAQYYLDIERLDRFMAAGWRVIRVNKDLMSRPADLFAKVRAALHP